MSTASFDFLFSNYELLKLPISYPTAQNLIILAVLLTFSLILPKKNRTSFMDSSQTDQLKGIAILLVVVGHLWVHVSENQPIPVLSGYSVSLFLVLSGYGLSISWAKKPLPWTIFITKRINRVMIPYWIITVVILLLDYLILDKTYPLKSIVYTFAGINFEKVLRQFDYARWYITLLLAYYAVFFFANRLFGRLKAVICLCVFGVALYFLRRQEIFPFGGLHHFLAFPLGCVLAHFHAQVSEHLDKNKRNLTYMLLIAFGIVGTHLLLLVGELGEGVLSKLIRLGVYNGQGLLFCLFLILCVGEIGRFGYVSRFLTFCGVISYEIYLIHGPLLVKYNPIFNVLPTSYIAVSFLFWLIIILVLSHWLRLMLSRIYLPLTAGNRQAM